MYLAMHDIIPAQTLRVTHVELVLELFYALPVPLSTTHPRRHFRNRCAARDGRFVREDQIDTPCHRPGLPWTFCAEIIRRGLSECRVIDFIHPLGGVNAQGAGLLAM